LKVRGAARAGLTAEAEAVANLLEISAMAWESLRLARDEGARGHRPACCSPSHASPWSVRPPSPWRAGPGSACPRITSCRSTAA